MGKLNKKRCKICKESLDINEFYRYKNNKDGLRHECKKCWDKKSQEWFKNNPNKRREYSKKFRLIHPEKRIEYYLKNKEHFLRKTYEWRKKNKDKFLL